MHALLNVAVMAARRAGAAAIGGWVAKAAIGRTDATGPGRATGQSVLVPNG